MSLFPGATPARKSFRSGRVPHPLPSPSRGNPCRAVRTSRTPPGTTDPGTAQSVELPFRAAVFTAALPRTVPVHRPGAGAAPDPGRSPRAPNCPDCKGWWPRSGDHPARGRVRQAAGGRQLRRRACPGPRRACSRPAPPRAGDRGSAPPLPARPASSSPATGPHPPPRPGPAVTAAASPRSPRRRAHPLDGRHGPAEPNAAGRPGGPRAGR